MKKTLSITRLVILLCALAMHTTKAEAQQNPMQILNDQLRTMFSGVNNPNPQVHFLYDMSTHLVDSAYFSTNCPDTSNTDNWYLLYREMFYAAYDTTQFLKDDTVFKRSWTFLQNDTIPLGLMDWDYNLLKPTALWSNTYFNFDTVNQTLTDKTPQPNSPYTIQNVFAGAPLKDGSHFSNVVFRIDPQFIFKDAGKDFKSGLKVDFGDGTGWHAFSGAVVTHYSVSYPGQGIYFIKFGCFDTNNQLIKSSTSSFKITSGSTASTSSPDSVWTDIPGIRVAEYDGCNQNTTRKYVIYLEGIDPLNNRNEWDIYQEMIHDENLVQLQNFGYSFLVVNFSNTYADLKDNAMSVVQLIDKLKRNGQLEPLVVIGESMGGLIGRYALCYMESPAYTNDQGRPRPDLMHNTRLFLTFDSPNQGANIPLSLQWMYRYIFPLTMLQSSFSQNIMQGYQVLLDGTSTKQMLLYHVETESFPAPVSSSTYGPSSLKLQFDADLRNLGNYPRYCKIVATGNGSFRGRPHHRWWDDAERVANDHLMQMNAETYLRVLGIRILGTRQELDLRTNPDGTGLVFRLRHGVSHWNIRLRWFGVRLEWGTDYLLSIEKTAENMQPYCVSAGSWPQATNQPFYSSIADYDMNVFSMFSVTSSTSNGQLNYSTTAGIPWLANGNLNFSLYSDGNNWSLIPVQSSFDYQQPHPLNYDILKNDPVGVIMDQTPFDAVITNPYNDNFNHLTVNNRPLELCQTCLAQPNADWIRSWTINREIGDDSLWLENTRTIIPFRIQPEQSLYINYRNPYYNYPTVQPNKQFYNLNALLNNNNQAPYIVLSKDRPYQIQGPPHTFSSNISFQVNPAQSPGNYSYVPGNMTICCVDYTLLRRTPQQPVPTTAMLNIYPNPAPGNHTITVNYRFTHNAPVTIDVYDVMGRAIAHYAPQFQDNTQSCFYAINGRMVPGMYIVKVCNGLELQTARIVISQ